MTELSAVVFRTHRLCEVFGEKRYTYLYAPATPVDARGWVNPPSNEAEFDQVVTEMYKKFLEAWDDDITALLTIGRESGVKTYPLVRFRGVVRDLRHGQQHDGTKRPELLEKRTRQLHEFCNKNAPTTPDDWEACHTSLLGTCKDGLEALVGIVNDISKDPAAIARWRESVSSSIDLPSITSDVLSSLRLSPHEGARGYIERSVERDWKHYRTGGRTSADDAAVVAERVVLGWSLSHLPCSPHDIADVASPNTQREAKAAMTFAHVLTEIADYADADEFVDQFERLWRILRDFV